LLFAGGKAAEGEQELLAALEIARSQQARADQSRIRDVIGRLTGKAPPV
jgi:hypothetical protein